MRPGLKYSLVRAAAAVVLTSFSASCELFFPEGPEAGGKETEETGLTIETSTAFYQKSSTWVIVKADGSWTLDIEPAVSWARLNTTSGSGNKSNIQLNWDKNSGEQDRSCTLVLRTDETEVRAPFRQRHLGLVPDEVPGWMELPATDDPNLYFFTLPMVIDGKKYRNYSFYYDKTNLVSRWVAYPLNSTLLKGSCGRTEAWEEMKTFPGIPEEFQPDLSGKYNGSGISRGHQIPSADRQIISYNKETYYGINMTPQNSSLNTGVWEKLEAYVRDRARKLDTLYVVTGCVVSPNYGWVYDSRSKKVTKPSGYFKALLGYSKKKSVGNTSSTGGYTAIGFYFDNAAFYGDRLDGAMTIDALEKKVGVDFFVNLPGAVGEANANKVESTRDNWWYN